MSELAVTLLRVGYLVLLWAFVFSALAVLRRDIYSNTKVTPRGRGRSSPQPQPAPRADTPTHSPFPSAPPVAATPAPAPVRQSITKPPARIVVTSGNLTGTSVPLGRSAIILGRSQSCTLVLDDDFASSRHARLFPDGDVWRVEDLGSTNGTLLDHKPVDGAVVVSAGSVIRIGRTTLELRR